MEKPSFDHVVSAIRDNWEAVMHPSAPDNLWSEEIQRLFPEYPVWNWTDFNYDKCHTYSVILHPGTAEMPASREEEVNQLVRAGGQRTYLWIALSVVAPFAHIRVETRTLTEQGDIQVRSVDESVCASEVERARRFFGLHGFTELPDHVLKQVIPDVELDLAPRGRVTVYNCLFYDEDS